MERYIINQLKAWKTSPRRKPLILSGARQVGKTYILRKFGAEAYDHVAYINCDDNDRVKGLFEQDYNMQRILLAIGAITGVPILPEKTLIILDEIQELHRGLSSLKYFCEEAPRYHVAVAGSLLGITMHQGESFPVGKVDIISMFPMTYEEFLQAKGKKQMVDLLQSKDWDTIKLLRTEYIQTLREYFFVGGMPEVVKTYLETNDAVSVRNIQTGILYAYNKDISKHAPSAEIPRINMVWQSIPSQLAKENKKFIYGMLKKGARAKEFELAIQWLIDAGLIYKISRTRAAKIPLKFYEDFSAFKLFLSDVGLLGALANVPPALMLAPNIMEEAKGAFTENYVACQLQTLSDTSIFYFSKDNSQLEIDFIIQHGTSIRPMEVKSEENLQSKSLKAFITDNPTLKGLRLSLSDYKDQGWMENIPLYALTGI